MFLLNKKVLTDKTVEWHNNTKCLDQCIGFPNCFNGYFNYNYGLICNYSTTPVAVVHVTGTI